MKLPPKYYVCDFCGRNTRCSRYEDRRCEHCGELRLQYIQERLHPAEGVVGGTLDRLKKIGKDWFTKHANVRPLVKRKIRTLQAINSGNCRIRKSS